MANPGDKVKLVCKDEDIEGILVQSQDPKFLVVKLDSGYNIGVAKNKVKKLEILQKKKEVALKKTEKKQSNKKTKITILHTGGTIAAKVDYKTGGVSAHFDPSEIIDMFPELGDIANIDSRLIRNIMSENMRFDHYNLLAKEVEKEVKKGTDGVIITHGTDTLHYTAAALSFALEGLPIPVLIIGSQRSSDRPSSDSYVNLISGAAFIANTNYHGVYVCMHETMNDDNCILIPGTKVRKMHTSRRDAFRPINTTATAKVNYETKKIQKIKSEKKQTLDFNVRLFNPKLKVGLFKMHNHMYVSEMEPYKKFDGLVIEAFALGQGQILSQDQFMKENVKIADLIRKLCKKMPVAVTSQCIYGRVDMNVYAEGREMQKLGVIGNDLDMTPETAFIKLAWLLSNYKKREEIEKLFSENLAGEISERVEKDTFLV